MSAFPQAAFMLSAEFAMNLPRRQLASLSPKSSTTTIWIQTKLQAKLLKTTTVQRVVVEGVGGADVAAVVVKAVRAMLRLARLHAHLHLLLVSRSVMMTTTMMKCWTLTAKPVTLEMTSKKHRAHLVAASLRLEARHETEHLKKGAQVDHRVNLAKLVAHEKIVSLVKSPHLLVQHDVLPLQNEKPHVSRMVPTMIVAVHDLRVLRQNFRTFQPGKKRLAA